jgi:peptide/nickel transport system permease protein
VTLALACAMAFVTLGTLLGAVGGFFGGWIDSLLTRLIETLTAFPPLVLVLAVQAMLPRPTLVTMLLAIGLIRWPEIARVVRAEILSVVSQEYVLAARALGASPLRVLVKHVAPNVKGPVLVAMTFGLASVVLVEASLSFLHVGVPIDTPSWGEMLSEVRGRSAALWLLLPPGVLLLACLASLNTVAETLRELLDPRSGL